MMKHYDDHRCEKINCKSENYFCAAITNCGLQHDKESDQKSLTKSIISPMTMTEIWYYLLLSLLRNTFSSLSNKQKKIDQLQTSASAFYVVFAASLARL